MRIQLRVAFFSFALALSASFAVLPLHASQNASVVGAVYDQQGNPITGAEVHLINDLTGFSRVQVTDATGGYTFNSVPATDPTEDEYYLLSVERPGYVRDERKVTVSVGDDKWIQPPFTLVPVQAPPVMLPPEQPKPETPKPAAPPSPPAPAPEAVKPRPEPAKPEAPKANPVKPAATRPAKPVLAAAPGEGPTVRTELLSTMLGGVIDSRALRTLPLVDRDFLDLALLTPGAYPVEQGSVLEGASLVVNGVRANMNQFLLDGADNNDYTINQSLPFQIVEAMQEFRVQASTSPAEFGRSGGAQINSITRRGLNTVHGAVFGFHRNSYFSSDQFFSAYNGGSFDRYNREIKLICDRTGTCGVNQPTDVQTLAGLYNRRDPQLIQNQFGGNLGGALKRDKLFAFVNWESSRISNPRPLFERVPGNTWRQAVEPCTGITLDPVALTLFSYYPSPNAPDTIYTNQSEPMIFDPSTSTCDFPDQFQSAFFTGESANRTHSDNALGRIDVRKSDMSNLSFKYNAQQFDQFQGGSVPRKGAYPGSGAEITGLNQNFSINYVQQLGSRLSNELRLGGNRFSLDSEALDRSIDPSAVGFQNLNFRNRGLPTLTIGGLFTTLTQDALLGSDLSVPSRRADNVGSAAESLSYTRGRNNVKFGGEYRYVRLDVANEAMGRGMLTFFSAPFVALFSEPDLASIARVSPTFGGGFDRRFLTQSYDGFVQDQWRARPNLAINFGVRYEQNTAPVEARDRLVNYYPALGGLVRAGTTTVLSPILDTSYNLQTLGQASSRAPRAGFTTDTNNFSPRFGFAWNPRRNGKTVVRGAYAVFYDQQPLEPSVNMLLNPPFVQQDFSLRTFFALDSTFQVGTPGFLSSNGWFRLPYSITARDPGARTSYVQQANFGLQRQLGGRAVFEAGYVGSFGRKLPRLRDISPCNEAIKGLSAPDLTVCFDLTKPFLFTSILNQENTARSDFHSLLARFEAKGFRGMQVMASYQLAKSIDDTSSMQPQVFLFTPAVSSYFTSFYAMSPDTFAGANNVSPTLSLRPDLPVVTTRARLPQDSDNLRAERGRSDFDVHHRLAANFIYDVPRAARLRGLGQGWQVAGIATWQTGQPFSVFEDFFGIPFRPNQLRTTPVNVSNPATAFDKGTPLGFVGGTTGTLAINFDPNTFFLKPGSLGRNAFTGPKFQQADFSVAKNFFWGGGERKSVQLRGDFFNAFNTLNLREPYGKGGLAFYDQYGTFFGVPTSVTVFDPFFAKIIQSRPPAEMQFALKINF